MAATCNEDLCDTCTLCANPQNDGLPKPRENRKQNTARRAKATPTSSKATPRQAKTRQIMTQTVQTTTNTTSESNVWPVRLRWAALGTPPTNVAR